MITIKEALNIIKDSTKNIGIEKVDLMSSLNRVLAEDIYSKDTLPPFNKSAMDGYAIKFEDTIHCNEQNEVKLNIVGTIKAGDYYTEELKHGDALKIMTGAAVPNGANAVIQIEKVAISNNIVTISEVVRVDTNIIKMGEEIKEGDIALTKGKLIRPTEIGFLASLGYSKVDVYKKPKVAILTTGDELLSIDSPLENGKIRNSNEYSLMALCKNLDVEYISLGIVADDKDILKEKMIFALKESDIVITSGGVSAGDFDFIEDVLNEIGADTKITSVAIKPGKPITFATIDNKLIFGLPGNPLSVITTFDTFVKPAIKNIMGYDNYSDSMIKVVAGDSFKTKNDREKYVYVNIIMEDDKYVAYNLGSQCSNHLMTMSKASGIMVVPGYINKVNPGDVLYGKFIFK